MKQKRTFKENVSMILRGYRIIYRIAPRYVRWNIAARRFRTVCPLFFSYMSSLVINELAFRGYGAASAACRHHGRRTVLLNLINR